MINFADIEMTQHQHALLDVRRNVNEQLATLMASDLDAKLHGVVSRYLGRADWKPEELRGRLVRRYYNLDRTEVFLIDGVPLLRAYPIECDLSGTMMSATQKFEELEFEPIHSAHSGESAESQA